jgi:tRNA guanosine-2'-O-methyltransferase
MVARALPESLREEYFTELVHTSLPLTSNSKVVVRHQAIAMTLEFWEHAERFSYTTLTSNPLFQRIYEASTNSSYYKEFKNAKDFRTFDGVRNFTMAGIFSGNYLRGGDEVEIIPDDAFAGLEDFEDGRRRRIPLGAAVDVVEAAATEPIVVGLHSGRVNYHPQDAARLAVLSNPPASAPLQTKGSDISTAAVEDDGADIILCASLLDNGFNLGGVSRVSEIMGIKTLTLASKAIVKTPEFTSVSVHSEAWLDIQEVPVPDIAAYLRAKRSEGYTAVGVEQTDRSVILGRSEWKFPKKTVLLLGTEKYGIPAELLGELDRCVEIPQKGRTRSMNVQTAAAVVLYEACRQAEM